MVTSVEKQALEDLLLLDDESLRREGLLALATEWAKIDPRQAAENLAALASGEDRDRLLGHVVAIWTKSDPKKCLAWIASAPVEEPTRQLMKERPTRDGPRALLTKPWHRPVKPEMRPGSGPFSP
ncbi:hypothetical protein OJ996_01745 [Luteolibacter sp. GHJ8]|uniref:HEAT repeat domain-containing protein n=1 Tax=Luteolibacter rhizosphaerae TaxID=2989719 RepID=A0ABT3FXH3_9BACT|nr:hypothetical protein [Luteolibacter rhizosphaerae]MCW1912276.1 hypothetical protein [Luteolibacter rhizosphaerae]